MTRTWTPDTETQKQDKTDYSTVKAWLNRYREAEKRYYLLPPGAALMFWVMCWVASCASAKRSDSK